MVEKNQNNSASADTDKPTNPSIVVSHFSSRGTLSIKKRLIIVAGIFLLLLAVATVIWYLSAKENEKTPVANDGYLLSREENGKLRSEYLLKNQPAADASNETKTQYYNDLMLEQYNAGNFRGVDETYRKSVKELGGSVVLYSSHLLATRAYIELNDKSAAKEALASTRAEVAQSPDDDLLINQDREKMLSDIENEINK